MAVTAPHVDPELRELKTAALAVLDRSAHPWAARLARALNRSDLRLKAGGGGFTIPLPGLGLNTIWLGEDLARRGVCQATLHTLLHEAAHQCGAVLPEWKLWFGRWGGLFSRDRIYGDDVNSADAIASEVLKDYHAPADAAQAAVENL